MALPDSKPTLDVPPDRLGLDQFADACKLAGGGLASRSEHSACCTICTEQNGCHDVCTDSEAIASMKELSPEEDAMLDQLVEDGYPGYSERQSGSDVDTYGLCLRICKFGYEVCKAVPAPVPHSDQFAFCTKGLWWGCIGACVDIRHGSGGTP